MKGGGGKQASIASFFTKKPGSTAAAKPAGPAAQQQQQQQRGVAAEASDGSKDKAAVPATAAAGEEAPAGAVDAQPAVPRKRLKRAIEDSPVKQAEQQEDEEEKHPPAAAPPPPLLSPLKDANHKAPQPGTAAAAPAAPPGSKPGAAAAPPQQASPAPKPTPARNAAASKASPGKPSPAAGAGGSRKRGVAGAPKAGGAAAGGAAAQREQRRRDGAEEDDPEGSESISFTASGDEGSGGSGDEEGGGGEVQSAGGPVVKRLKARDDTSGPKKKTKKATGKAGASTLEGVGTGALEAALRACEADVPALCTWAKGAPVPYAFLADTLESIAEESKRLVITSILTNCFRAILATTPEDLLPAVYMCVNRVAPAHHGIELGVGESILIKALAKSSGRNEAAIKEDYKHSGDLGTVAVNARSTQRTMFQPKPNTIRGVFQVFKDIAASSGSSSQDRKVDLVIKLLVAGKGT